MSDPVTRPSRALTVLLGLCLLIDAAAGIGLALLTYHDMQYGGASDDRALLLAMLLALALFVAGSAVLWRRGHRGWAMTLALIPAVLSVLVAAAIALFFASFGSEPHH